jgi:hypothetical protein
MVDILEASGANKPKPGLVVTPISQLSGMDRVRPQLEAASALQTLGRELGTIAEQFDAAAVPAAQAAGFTAVGRDEAGHPTVELKPFAVSKSDRAFNSAATQGFLSQYQMDAQRGLQDIAARNQGSPAAFDTEARAYIKSLGASAKELRPVIQAEADKIRQQHFLTLSNAAVQRKTAGAKDAVLVQIDTTSNDLYALARQGGVGTDEFRAAGERLGSLYSQLKGNPLFGVAAERADSELRTTMDRARGLAMSSEAVRIYDAQGEKAAQKWLIENVRDNPNLKLDDSQRSGLVEIGRNAIAMRKGDNKAAIDANKATASVLARALENGQSVPQGSVEQAIETATRLGDAETAAKLLTSKQVYGRSEASRGLSDEERVRQATSTPVAPADVHSIITQAADRYGISHSYALRVAHIESRFDPNAINGGSKATGLFQFIPSTWRSFGQGQSALDPAANADAAMRFAVANRDQLRRSLGRGPTEGELYLAHQQGAGGAAKLLAAPNVKAADLVGERAVLGNGGNLAMTAGQFAQMWIRKVDGANGTAPAPAMIAAPYTQQQLAQNPYLASTWLRSQMAGNKELIESAKYVISAASNAIDKGSLPDPETLAGAIQIAQQNPDALGRVKDELIAKIKGFDAGEEANRGGVAAGAALVEDAMRRAQGAPILVRLQAEAMKEAIERGARNLKESPWDEAARRGWSPGPLPPLDFSSADAFAQAMAARSSVATAISARTGAPQSVLSPTDIIAMQGTLRDGMPAQRSVIVAELARMPDEQLGRVMADRTVKDTLIGMSRSGDPSKMSAAFSLMDRAQAADPDGFHSIYGKDVENRLAAWTSRMSYMSPQDLAGEIAKENDPTVQKARETMRDEAMKKVEKLTPGEIAGFFDQSVLPFTAPSAPVQTDRGDASRFADEYRREFAEAYAAIGGDESKAKDLAVQRLGRVWGESVLSGGRLMKFAPEKSPAYPTINGSHEWLAKQLDNDIYSALVGMGALVTDPVDFSGATANSNPDVQLVHSPRATAMLNLPRTLIADRRTEAEWSNGQPPSYAVVLKAPNGMWVPLQDAQGRQLRFIGDAEVAMEPVRARAAAELENRAEAERLRGAITERNARRFSGRRARM